MKRHPLTIRRDPQHRDIVARSIHVRAGSLNEETRSVEAVLSTEGVAQVFDWQRMQIIDEILLARGASFGSQVPLLESHSRWSTNDVLGSVRGIRVDGNQVIGRPTFAAGDPVAERAYNLVKQGHITDVSIGYRADEFVDIPPNTSREVMGKTYTAGHRTLRVTTKYTIREGSLVPIGADQAAKIRQEAGLGPQPEEKDMRPELRKFLESLGLRHEATEAEAVAFHKALGGPNRTRADGIENGTITPAPEPTPAPTPAPAPVAQRSEPPAPTPATPPINEQTIRAAERARIARLQELAGTDVPAELVTRSIAEGWTEEQASREFLTAIRASRTPPASRAPAQINRNHERDCSERALAFGLMNTLGLRMIDPNATETVRREQEQFAERGDRYRGMSLLDICRESLRLDGREVGYNREETIRSAVSTAAMTNIFTTSVNARLLQTYAEAVDSTQGWTSEEDVADFKSNDRIALGQSSGLARLTRGDTAKHATGTDSVESYKVHRYARQFVVDEQDIIDNNLTKFTEIPTQMGQAAARLRPDLVYSILLANAALNADSVELFHAGHANLGTGGGTALSATSLQAGVLAMAKQTEGGVNLNLAAQFLILPHDIRWTAQGLLKSAEVRDTTASTKYPTYNVLQDLNLSLRVDNRLGTAGVTDPVTGTAYTGTATNWFLATAPNGRTIVVGYLAGTGRKPMLRSFVLDRGQWGIGWDCKFDIGAKALDYRGLYKANGA